MVEWSAKRLKEQGADAVKFCFIMMWMMMKQLMFKTSIYRTYWFRVCCRRYSILLEVLSYDDKIADNKSAEFAKVKPHKVNEAMKLFSQERFNVDVLKVEVPVNMNYVEGFAQGEVVYSKRRSSTIL